MITVGVYAFNQEKDETEKVGDIIWDGEKMNGTTDHSVVDYVLTHCVTDPLGYGRQVFPDKGTGTVYETVGSGISRLVRALRNSGGNLKTKGSEIGRLRLA